MSKVQHANLRKQGSGEVVDIDEQMMMVRASPMLPLEYEQQKKGGAGAAGG